MKIFWKDICLFLQLLYYGGNDFRELELSRDSCTLYKENAWAMMLTRQRAGLLERNSTMCLTDKPSQEKQCTEDKTMSIMNASTHEPELLGHTFLLPPCYFPQNGPLYLLISQMLPCWPNFLSLFSTNVLLVSLIGLFRNLFYNATRAQSLTKILLV